MKLAVIGAGSTYTPELVDDLVCMKDLLPIGEVDFYDIDDRRLEFSAWLPVRSLVVDNDTFALLHTGHRQDDAVAVVCGAGVNCVGESREGRTVCYPVLGWESGDWGGSEIFGRDALFFAYRALDGRGEPSVLGELIESHFGRSLEEVGAAVHYGRVPLGALAPAVVVATESDPVAATLVERLALELSLMAWKALRDPGALEWPADMARRRHDRAGPETGFHGSHGDRQISPDGNRFDRCRRSCNVRTVPGHAYGRCPVANDGALAPPDRRYKAPVVRPLSVSRNRGTGQEVVGNA